MEECPHAHVIPTRFTMSNGVVMVTMQCQDCGQRHGDGKNKDYDMASLPDFDNELREQGWARRREGWAQERAEADQAWWLRYDAYLVSPHWKQLRRRVIARDGFRCQNCFCKITDATAEVHHKTYDAFNRLGYSFAFECVALCPKCHNDFHGRPDDEVPF